MTAPARSGGRPASPVDLARLRRRLEALGQLQSPAEVVGGLGRHLPDLFALAYERAVGGERVGGRSHIDGYAQTDVGDRRAKAALAQLDEAARLLGHWHGELVKAVSACENLYGVGEVDETLRGTMLGDARGHHAAAELAQLLKAQGRRRERDEYVPVSVEVQPELAKPKSKKGKRKGRR